MRTPDEIIKEVREIAQQALDREKICLDVLSKIACWEQGPKVTVAFDEPSSAQAARDCLNYLDTLKLGRTNN